MLLTITSFNSAYIYHPTSRHMEYLDKGDALLLLTLGYKCGAMRKGIDGALTCVIKKG